MTPKNLAFTNFVRVGLIEPGLAEHGFHVCR